MKPTPFLLIGAGTACAIAALLVHFHLSEATRRRIAETAQAQVQITSHLRHADELAREGTRLRAELASSSHPNPTASTPVKTAREASESDQAIALVDPKSVAITRDPELRKLHLQAHVYQQRLALAGFLKTSGVTATQLSRFDQIQSDYQQGLLDGMLSAAENGWKPTDPRLTTIRAQLLATRNAQCEDLFAAQLQPWLEAGQALGSRQVVNQIMQQNLQGPGALNEAAALQLTQILAGHRLDRKTSSSSVDPTGYDWAAILTRAETVLNQAQFVGFRTSVTYYQAQARMNAFGTR